MVKYILRRKDNGKITYVYRTGFKVSVRPNYPKFLNDLVRYAGAREEDIETQEDLLNLFDKAKGKGADFNRSGESDDAVVREWKNQGNVFREKKEERKKFLERDIEHKLRTKRERKIFRRNVVIKYGRGKPVMYQETRVLFRFLEKPVGDKNKT